MTRSAQVWLLALLYATEALFCVAGALWPLRPDSPVVLGWLYAALGVAAAAAIWRWGPRRPALTSHLGLAVMSALVALLAARSVTGVGVVGLGPVLMAMAMYAAHFLSRRAAWVHVGLLMALATAGAVASPAADIGLAWVIVVVTTVVLARAHGHLIEQMRRAADRDPLTGLANRRAWAEEVTRALARDRRRGRPTTVVILDLDDFKRVNDTDGHGAGDDLLRHLAECWAQHLRAGDLLGRHGGDEFVLCLPETDARAAGEVLERLGSCRRITWSTGVATATGAGALETVDALLGRADDALYERKRARLPAAGPEEAAVR